MTSSGAGIIEASPGDHPCHWYRLWYHPVSFTRQRCRFATRQCQGFIRCNSSRARRWRRPVLGPDQLRREQPQLTQFYPFGRGDLGRTPAFTRTDLLLQHNFRLFGSQRINVGLNIENLFDHQTVTRRFQVVNRDTFNVSDQVFFSGTFDPIALQAANPTTYRPDPRFNLPDQWQQPRELRLQIRYSF